MAWVNSKTFARLVVDSLAGTAPFDLNSDQLRIALYNDSVTPANAAASADTAYGAGTWATASAEQSDAGQWDAGGLVIPSVTVANVGPTITVDGGNVESGSACTIAAFGGLVYDDTLASPVADQGVCFVYFGGEETQTNGIFRVVWAAAGIATFSVQ